MTHELYATGRAEALPHTPDSNPPPPDYALVRRLRAVRDEGQEAMSALEHYDPNFSLRLSECEDEAAAIGHLKDWLERRVTVLEQCRSRLEETWRSGVAERHRREAPHPAAPDGREPRT